MRSTWYYTHYLNSPDDSIESAQVNIVVPLQYDASDIVLDDPVGQESAFVGTTYPIWWYQWGTDIRTVKVFLSTNSGYSWSYLGWVPLPITQDASGRWEDFVWQVTDIPTSTARIRLEAYDANNAYIAGDGSLGDFYIFKDTKPPTGSISINSSAPATNNPAVTLTLQCVDSRDSTNPGPPSGCADMRFSADNATWSAWETYATTRAYTLVGADGVKTVYVEFRDRVGNVSTPYLATITLDRTGPKVTVTINGGATYSTSPSVTLSLTCTNNDCVQMRFEESYSTTWTAWEPFHGSKAYTFATVPANGRVALYVAMTDPLGNQSETAAYIILDTAAPTGGLLINNNAKYTNSTAVTLTLSCSDYQSGCADMQFSSDNVVWTAWQPVSATVPWTLTAGDGVKTVYAQFRDNVGHLSGVGSVTIILETVPPSGTVVINSGEASTNAPKVTLALTCTDATSGCLNMRFSNDGEISESLGGGRGLKTVGSPERDRNETGLRPVCRRGGQRGYRLGHHHPRDALRAVDHRRRSDDRCGRDRGRCPGARPHQRPRRRSAVCHQRVGRLDGRVRRQGRRQRHVHRHRQQRRRPYQLLRHHEPGAQVRHQRRRGVDITHR